MDHDHYRWSMLTERKPVEWPGGHGLALWINVSLQFFPLNQQGEPFKVPGGMTMPYPDLRHYSLREYGNRVGIFRILDALDRYGLRSSFAMNTRLAERYPYLVGKIVKRDDEILCHGYTMDDLHYGGQNEQHESELIGRSLARLKDLTGQPVRGWLSPARNESENTPKLLAANGIEYFCDWVNDEMPYPFLTDHGELTAMPLSAELEDFYILHHNQHAEQSYLEQVCDAKDFLQAEAHEQGGRILALNIHPWLLGQPHRIGFFEKLLARLSADSDIWNASPSDILKVWKGQQQTD